jgi:alpha-tubulin suppressor-like RCC1 family protein
MRHSRLVQAAWVFLPALHLAQTAFGAGPNVVSFGGAAVPSDLTNAVMASKGDDHSLALRADGTVVAWGANYYGQSTVPAGLGNVVAVSAYGEESLALRADGTVVAWGDSVPVAGGLTDVAELSGGTREGAALRADGSVLAWPENDAPSDLANVVDVAAGGSHNLALRADGTVVAFPNGYVNGFPDAGQRQVPTDLTNAVAVAAGGYHSLALRANGTVAAWGGCWDGTTSVPVTVPPWLSNVVAVAASDDHDLALRSDGTVVAWGYNGNGATNVPVSLTQVVAVATGLYDSLAVVGKGPPFILTPLVSRQVCVGGTVYFRGAAAGVLPLSYQWQCNGTNLPGATDSVLALTNVQPNQAGEYSVVVSNSLGAGASAPAHLDVVAALITTQPKSQIGLLGETATFTVEAQALAPDYQWRFNGTDLPGATNSTLTLANLRLDQAGAYSVVISNAWGTVTSSDAVLQVNVVEAWSARGYDLRSSVPAGLTNVVQVSAAKGFNYWDVDCALRGDGSVVGWSPSGGRPPFTPGLKNVAAVASGATLGGHIMSSCLALLRDGTVVSWPQPAPSMPVGLCNVTAVGTVTMSGWGDRSLALRADGTVVAFGVELSGETDILRSLTNAVAIAAGYAHSLALRADGTVVEWGTFYDTNYMPIDVPVPPGLSNVVAIAAGDEHSLALRSDGAVVAWGDNPAGETNVPDGLTNVVAIAAARRQSLALRADGTVVAWGGYWDGWNGVTWVPTTVMPGLTNVVALDAGPYASVALLGDGTPFVDTVPVNRTTFLGGTVYFRAAATRVWPVNYQWQHYGTNLPGATGPVLVLSDVAATQAGPYSVVVSNAIGSVTRSAQCLAVLPTYIATQPQSQVSFVGGTATLTVEAQATAPLSYQWQFNGTDLAGATNASLTLSNLSLAQDGIYSVVLSNCFGLVTSQGARIEVGNVAAWGSYYYSQLGSYLPMPVAPGLGGVLAVAAGYSHCLGLRADGTVAAWGDNSYGATTVPVGLSNVVAVAAGYFSSVALLSDGTVAAWGDNYYGQINVPRGLSDVVAIAAGFSHSLALQADGTVSAWGSYWDGTTNVPMTVPVKLTDVVGVAAGGNHNLALRADGTVVGWGANWSGQTDVPDGLTNVVAIAAGGKFSLALGADGALVAWGTYPDGTNEVLMTVPPGLTDVVAVAAGDSHSLALRGNGTLVAWGACYNGENFLPASVPSELTNVVAMAAGSEFDLALIGDGPPVVSAFMSRAVVTVKGFSVSVPTQSGRVYALEYKTSLADPAWTHLPLVAGTGHELTLTDPTVLGAQRFYRVRRW